MAVVVKADDRSSSGTKKIDRFVGIPLVILLALWRPLKRVFKGRLSGPPRKILISKLSAMGDAVLMLPALHLLKRRFPGAQLVFLGGSSNQSFVSLLSCISRFEKFSIKTALSLACEEFDLFIDFDQWVRATAVISGLSRATKTIGFRSRGQWRHFAYDKAVMLDLKKHMAWNFWNLAANAGDGLSPDPGGTFESDRDEAREKWAPEILGRAPEAESDAPPYVVLHPGCGENGKFREWPLSSWLELISAQKAAFPNTRIFVTGHGPYEVGLAQVLEKAGTVSKAGLLNLAQTARLLHGAQVIYSTNTGIMHLASFVNDRVVAVNGPTNSHLWGPLWKGKTIRSPLECAPCLTWGYDYGCSDPVCLKVITAKQVFKASHAETTSEIF